MLDYPQAICCFVSRRTLRDRIQDSSRVRCGTVVGVFAFKVPAAFHVSLSVSIAALNCHTPPHGGRLMCGWGQTLHQSSSSRAVSAQSGAGPDGESVVCAPTQTCPSGDLNRTNPEP